MAAAAGAGFGAGPAGCAHTREAVAAPGAHYLFEAVWRCRSRKVDRWTFYDLLAASDPTCGLPSKDLKASTSAWLAM